MKRYIKTTKTGLYANWIMVALIAIMITGFVLPLKNKTSVGFDSAQQTKADSAQPTKIDNSLSGVEMNDTGSLNNKKTMKTIINERPKELGKVSWFRNYEKAVEESKRTGKPIFLLFQEVPGCSNCVNFGHDLLSYPIICGSDRK